MTKTQEKNRTQFAVLYLHNEGKTPQNISKTLGIELEKIEEIVGETKKQNSIKTTTSKVNSKDLMITATAGKGTKNVAIMTKAASEVNDAYKKETKNTQSRTSQNAIFKPKT